MRTSFNGAILAILIPFTLGAKAAEISSVVKIRSTRCDNPARVSEGSGLLFQTEGSPDAALYVLTSEHVISEPDRYDTSISHSCNEMVVQGKTHSLQHLSSDWAYGLSLFRVKPPFAAGLASGAFRLNPKERASLPEYLAKVRMRGFLVGSHSPSEHQAFVANPKSQMGFIPAAKSLIQMSQAEVTFGFSGAPLFNHDGTRFLGLLSSQTLIQRRSEQSVPVTMAAPAPSSTGTGIQTIIQYSQPFAISAETVFEFLNRTLSKGPTPTPVMQRLSGEPLRVSWENHVYRFQLEPRSREPKAGEAAPIEIGGDLTGIGGDLTGIGGDLTGIGGDLTGIGGDLTGIGGDLTGIGGDLTGIGGDLTGIGGDPTAQSRGTILVNPLANAITPPETGIWHRQLLTGFQKTGKDVLGFQSFFRPADHATGSERRLLYLVYSLEQVLTRAYQNPMVPLIETDSSDLAQQRKLARELLGDIQRFRRSFPSMNGEIHNLLDRLQTEATLLTRFDGVVTHTDLASIRDQKGTWDQAVSVDFSLSTAVRSKLMVLCQLLH